METKPPLTNGDCNEVNRDAKRAILIICTLAVIGTAGYLLVAHNARSDGLAGPRVGIGAKSHDFGEVDPNSTLKHSFDIRNDGGETLEIKRVRIDCACGRVQAESDRIAPGETGLINLEYDTPSDAGPFTANILIETNDPARRFVKFQITGTVRGEHKEGVGSAKQHSDTVAAASIPSDSADDALRIVVFYSPTCGGCERLFAILDDCQSQWPGQLKIDKRDITQTANLRDLVLYEDHYGSAEDAAPKVFVGAQHLAGLDKTLATLKDTIEAELTGESVTWLPPEADAEPAGDEVPAEILARFESFSVAGIVIAGLLDGINPCAFTTIVFFLSMLAYLGKSKREMAIVGVGFTLAIFVTYFLLGLGLLSAVKSFSVGSGIADGIAVCVAILAFVLAGWSFVDFARTARSGDVSKATLGLPKSIKSRIHKVIRVGLTTRNLVVGSLTIGVLVALLESLCTGQLYLPVIVIVTRAPGLRTQAVSYLLLYNVMFIAPLVAILVVAYLGVKSEKLGQLLRRHLAVMKLAMAVLFAGLGVLVLLTL